MKIGDKDGVGRIYNELGELILDKNEKLQEVEEINGRSYVISDSWGSMAHVIFAGGSGDLYLTSKRIVIIQEPSVSRAIDTVPLYEVPTQMIKAKELQKYNYKEYFELFRKEIIGYKKGWFGAEICIYSNYKRYALGFNYKSSNVLKNYIKSLSKVDRKLESKYYELEKDPNIPICDRCKSEDVNYYGDPDGILIPHGTGKCNLCGNVFNWKSKWPRSYPEK